MIRITGDPAPRFADKPKSVVHAPVVHAPVVHAKRKPGLYLDPDARRAYRAEWMRQRRAAAKAHALAGDPINRGPADLQPLGDSGRA